VAKVRSVRRVALLSMHSSPMAPLGSTDAGGMNLYVRRLADDLSACGLDVDVFTRRTDREVPDVILLPSGARLVQLTAGPTRRLPKSVLPLHLPSMVAALKEFTDSRQIEYDLIHSHYWLSGLVAMRYRGQGERQMPIVHMFHTLAKVKDFYLGESDPADSALRADGERCVMGRADVIVGATEGELGEMSSLYGRTPLRYAVIPPGVDLDTFRPLGREESRGKLGIRADKVIVFVGRDDRMKGLQVLLRSVAALPTPLQDGLKVLVVGGDGGAKTSGRHNRYAAKLGLRDIVEVRGKATQTELPLYYSAANVCAVPSAYESFGMAAIESMACQTPVVAFAVGGLACTVKHGQTGFLARVGNPDDYGAQLSLALTSENLEAMGRQARMSVQRYTWSRVTERTLQLYERVAQEARETSVPAMVSG
jgi:D-inositol-3-phosphate glycosyltransferase